MKKIKLTFESKNLVVDWIGFNIQGFVDVRPIATYFKTSDSTLLLQKESTANGNRSL
jgi:hypothetical protein